MFACGDGETSAVAGGLTPALRHGDHCQGNFLSAGGAGLRGNALVLIKDIA